MRDKCAACGRLIFTTHLRGHGITLARKWTHGGYGFIDKRHLPIPTKHEYRIIR